MPYSRPLHLRIYSCPIDDCTYMHNPHDEPDYEPRHFTSEAAQATRTVQQTTYSEPHVHAMPKTVRPKQASKAGAAGAAAAAPYHRHVGVELHHSLGQHLLKNPLVTAAMIEKAGVKSTDTVCSTAFQAAWPS
eukprot:6196906-Pleurochrysis_carterae.AAC.1